MFEKTKNNIDTIRKKDPAAKSAIEILLLYPGYKAIRMHGRAQWFYKHKWFFIARWISQRAVRRTGIEIHPAAQIGKNLFIDHGSGVVIGETAIIGDNVTIYQGVTLGGTGKDIGKRHPTIGDNVIIGSGAKILGPFKVGDNSRIAAGAVVLNEVPDNSTAVGVPARVVRQNGIKVVENNDSIIVDPLTRELCLLQYKIKKLEEKINKLEEVKNENI